MTPDLLSRLSAATAGSAELDREVLLACGWTDRGEGRIAFRWVDPGGVLHSLDVMPTRSLDDITRMIEEAGMFWDAQTEPGGKTVAGVCLGQFGADTYLEAEHKDTRLALSIAFLRAREAGR